jgi:hypothetical protein
MHGMAGMHGAMSVQDAVVIISLYRRWNHYFWLLPSYLLPGERLYLIQPRAPSIASTTFAALLVPEPCY